MNAEYIRHMAKKTFLAQQAPYPSVEKVFPQVIDKVNKANFSYMGVKNRPEIPRSLISKLESTGNYGLHTLDAHSLGGRAIDTRMTNPITCKPMTGSSSGTAINVLTGINDLGIGTDGGGSVLAPAMSLNLFGFISPSLCKDHTVNFKKLSTDTHAFTPSIGFITREFDELDSAIRVVLPVPTLDKDYTNYRVLNVNQALDHRHFKPEFITTGTDLDLNGSREQLITFVKNNLNHYGCILSKEGPVDFNGLGDTVLGHMGSEVKSYQHQGSKGLIRVANMANAAAITIPTRDHGTSYVLLCEDTSEKIAEMLQFASELAIDQDDLLKRYFMNFDHYFAAGFLESTD